MKSLFVYITQPTDHPRTSRIHATTATSDTDSALMRQTLELLNSEMSPANTDGAQQNLVPESPFDFAYQRYTSLAMAVLSTSKATLNVLDLFQIERSRAFQTLLSTIAVAGVPPRTSWIRSATALIQEYWHAELGGVHMDFEIVSYSQGAGVPDITVEITTAAFEHVRLVRKRHPELSRYDQYLMLMRTIAPQVTMHPTESGTTWSDIILSQIIDPKAQGDARIRLLVSVGRMLGYSTVPVS